MYEERCEENEDEENAFKAMVQEFPLIYRNMVNKYQYLLMQESMVRINNIASLSVLSVYLNKLCFYFQRHVRTAELMMVDRMLNSDVENEILEMQLKINEYMNPSLNELHMNVESQQAHPMHLQGQALQQPPIPVTVEEYKVKKEEIQNIGSPHAPQYLPEGSNSCSMQPSTSNTSLLAIKTEIKSEGNPTDELVAYRHHSSSSQHHTVQLASTIVKSNAMKPSSEILKKEMDSFDDIESEITPSFIMKKCDSVPPVTVAQQAPPAPPSLSYFNHVGESHNVNQNPSARIDVNRASESYDEWLCIQKELNLSSERREHLAKNIKSPEEEIIEKQLDDLFNPSSEGKDSEVSRSQVDSPLADFFNAHQQDSGVGGSAGGSSVPSDKSVENRLEALFGSTPLHNRSSEDNSPEAVDEKQNNLMETRLEALFQSGESALDNSSFLHKTNNFEMIQTQITQKRHWNTSECDWEDSGSSGKRQCLPGNPSRAHDDDHRWLLECTQAQNQSHSNHHIAGLRGHTQVQQDVNALNAGNNHILNDNGNGNGHIPNTNTSTSGSSTNTKRTSWNGDILLASATGDLDMLDTNLSLSLNNLNSMCGSEGIMTSDVPSSHHGSIKSSKNCFHSPVLGAENCDDTNLIGLGTGGGLNNSSHSHSQSSKLNYIDRDILGLDGSNDTSKSSHQQSMPHSVANDLQHQLSHINFDASGGQLNFDDDINRQVQNAIDSILNLQSNDSEAALHFSLDQSFLADSPQSVQRPPSSNKRKYHHINRMDDINDCLSVVMDDGGDNHGVHNHHQQQQQQHLQNHFNHVHHQSHNHQQLHHHHQHHQAQTEGASPVVDEAGTSTGDGRANTDLPVKTIIKS